MPVMQGRYQSAHLSKRVEEFSLFVFFSIFVFILSGKLLSSGTLEDEDADGDGEKDEDRGGYVFFYTLSGIRPYSRRKPGARFP